MNFRDRLLSSTSLTDVPDLFLEELKEMLALICRIETAEKVR